MIRHKCHALGCPTSCPPRFLMCYAHWKLVPINLQRKVWLRYRLGQEIDKRPSKAYLDAADEAIKAVAKREELSREYQRKMKGASYHV